MTLPRPTRPADPRVTLETSSTRQKKIDPKQLRPSDVFHFAPQPDITTAELAELISTFWDITIHFERFLKFPEHLQRHFRHIKVA